MWRGFKALFDWLGVEATGRAITLLLALGAAIGGSAWAVVGKVAPMLDPALGDTTFAEGYRTGQRQRQLEQEALNCATLVRVLEAKLEFAQKLARMNDKEREEWLRTPDEFSRDYSRRGRTD